MSTIQKKESAPIDYQNFRGTTYLKNKDNSSNLAKPEDIKELKLAVFNDKVVKGMKEILKAIEINNVKKVFIAKGECDLEYSSIVEEFKTIYRFELVEVESWIELRDIVFAGSELPSSIIVEKARMKGVTPKIHPKCYAVCIVIESLLKKKNVVDEIKIDKF